MANPGSGLRFWPMPDARKFTNSPLRQIFRYGLMGLTINLAGYLVYLLVTFLGATPKITMSLLYVAGAAAGYWGNRQLTFMHRGSMLASGTRYLLAHGMGYLINLTILMVFVDRLGFAHQWVQAVAIFIVAGYLFLAFKFFVFADWHNPSGERS